MMAKMKAKAKSKGSKVRMAAMAPSVGPRKGGTVRSQTIIASKPGARGQTGSEDREINKIGGGKLMDRGIKR